MRDDIRQSDPCPRELGDVGSRGSGTLGGHRPKEATMPKRKHCATTGCTNVLPERPTPYQQVAKNIEICTTCYGKTDVRCARRLSLGLPATGGTGPVDRKHPRTKPRGSDVRKSAKGYGGFKGGEPCDRCENAKISGCDESKANAARKIGLCGACYAEKPTRTKQRVALGLPATGKCKADRARRATMRRKQDAPPETDAVTAPPIGCDILDAILHVLRQYGGPATRGEIVELVNRSSLHPAIPQSCDVGADREWGTLEHATRLALVQGELESSPGLLRLHSPAIGWGLLEWDGEEGERHVETITPTLVASSNDREIPPQDSELLPVLAGEGATLPVPVDARPVPAGAADLSPALLEAVRLDVERAYVAKLRRVADLVESGGLGV